MTPNQWLRLLPLIVFLLLSMMLSLGLFESKNPNTGTKLENRTFPSLLATVYYPAETPVPFSPELWRGNVVLFNVFASWCQPCAVEHPILMKLAKSGRVKIVGPAWKDTREKLAAYLAQHGNPYALIALDEAGNATVPLGLTGIPETLLVDGDGKIVFSSKQPITDEMVENEILPLVKKIQAQGKQP